MQSQLYEESKTAMFVAVLPYEYKLNCQLADVPLEDLHWPLGDQKLVGTISDLAHDDHLMVFPRSKYFWDLRWKVICRISIVIAEPFAIHNRNYLAALITQKRFFRIITHRPFMANWAKNALVMPFGGGWVEDKPIEEGEKTHNMSLIASTKQQLKGHKLRHEVADWSVETRMDVDLLGHGYKPLKVKADGLRPYRFSIVIENVQEEGYFTEKLIDCLLCDTVPIYWGAPDIAKYFDVSGMYICNSFDDIKQAVHIATSQDYDDWRATIAHNHNMALRYTDYLKNAAQKLLQGCYAIG